MRDFSRSYGTRAGSVLALAGVLAVGLTAGGCGLAYRPYFDPGGSGAAIDEYTYVSTAHAPQTVTVVDTRTGESVFTVDVPVGEQLVINFDADRNPDHETMPDEMRWRIMPAGNRYGKLRNRMPMPPASARRVDVTLRTVPELPTAQGGPATGMPSSNHGSMDDSGYTPPPMVVEPRPMPTQPSTTTPAPTYTPPPAPMEEMRPMDPAIDLPD